MVAGSNAGAGAAGSNIRYLMGIAGDDGVRCWELSLCCLSVCLPACLPVGLSSHCLLHAVRLPVVCVSFSSRLSCSSLVCLPFVCRLFFVCRCLPVVCLAYVSRLLVVCRSSGSRLSVVCRSRVPHLSCLFSVYFLSVVCLLPICRLSRSSLSFLLKFIFCLSSVARLSVACLSSVCRLPVSLYLACAVCPS